VHGYILYSGHGILSIDGDPHTTMQSDVASVSECQRLLEATIGETPHSICLMP
jgi:hypothetical protein